MVCQVQRASFLNDIACRMALISLEDLEGLDDEQLDDDISDAPEPMAEEEQDRLLSHWQAVASTHQVSVPAGEGSGLHAAAPIRTQCFSLFWYRVPEMTGPIQEMTRNSQQTEPLPFSVLSRHEKVAQQNHSSKFCLTPVVQTSG